MNQKLFRKVALDRLTSPEHLDEMMTITTPRGWIVIVAVTILMAMSMWWLFYGSIVVKVVGTGMFVSSAGVFNVVHHTGGQLVSIYARPGDVVHKGESVAQLTMTDLNLQISQARADLRMATNQQDSNSRLAQISLLEAKQREGAQIVSPVTGTVLEIKKHSGEYLASGQPLLSLTLADTDRGTNTTEVILYVPSEQGGGLVPDTEVQITPSTVKREEYGYMVGKIRSVSEYPVSSEGMMGRLGNKELIQKFLNGVATVREVQVELMRDPTTANGYLWSSRQGASIKNSEGTLCQGTIIMEKRRPVDILFLRYKQILQGVVD